jgi:hypothetical protein
VGAAQREVYLGLPPGGHGVAEGAELGEAPVSSFGMSKIYTEKLLQMNCLQIYNSHKENRLQTFCNGAS